MGSSAHSASRRPWLLIHPSRDVGAAVGNPGPDLELPWELVSIGVMLVPVSRIGEDQLSLPWADCSTSTSELIGEDWSAIIRLDAG